ncbi:hypothetical protein PseBG33_5314 [Pseudomonas synxantha BG33R]|uniref:hypothetical protein n=1 Tax=Pseudomonas TaxID=286 RepID=UPI00025FFA86|nr:MULTISPECIES: hypothetical protein [Pseudomonas]EIK71550.1 hypothetical protein PseBG33_5314 [Pseudomonas synxantha BG33R]QOY71342.1 hypothetical protein IH404_26980 [Pseudomonas sp. OST1909]WPN54235.1 hypothetical protein QMK52_08790 [Pseudomonas sp. P9_2]
MRYLKATAQDRCGNGVADTVIVHFYQRHSTGIDELHHEAVATDIDADEIVDFQCSGDINFDGKSDVVDYWLLKAFANTFLRLNWFNKGESWRRTLMVMAIQDEANGLPHGVQLNFLDRRHSPLRKPVLVYQAAGYDTDHNGVLESFTAGDVDRNGVADKDDTALIRSMCINFLAFKWYDHAHPSLNKFEQGVDQCAI